MSQPQSHPPPAGGFSLFPNTNPQRPPSRNQTSRSASRTRTTTPQPGQEPASSVEMTPPRSQRKPSVRRQPSVRDRQASGSNGRQAAMDGRNSAMDGREEEPVITRPAPVAVSEVPPRCDTAFSEAPTLVRNASTRSRSSIAKPPILYEPPLHPDAVAASSSQQQDTGLRSIFPTYNPSIPLDRQEYYPTQASPTHIPRAVISRPLYSPEPEQQPPLRTPGPALRSPMSAATPMSNHSQAPGRWPPRAAKPTPIPPPSTSADLQGLWKVANGWKASPSEARTYCLKMTKPEQDAPIYTLSSATQPFYNLRLDPTSASAYVTLSRHDPHKSYKGAPPTTSSSSAASTSSSSSAAKNWSEALTTTLEEESRRHPPHGDGLVALLYPSAATKMALDRPDDAATVARAENECARLVWDSDSRNYFLVHPALAMPFCITVERNPAWSRTEYTVEHLESPQHIARLTRHGTGNGWLEVDTSIAAKIEAVYLVDVVVTALMLVAHKDDAFAQVEVFEPPPVFLREDEGGRRNSSRLSSHLSLGRSGGGDKREKKKPGKKGVSRMEEFEIDVESQSSGKYGMVKEQRNKKKKKQQKEDKLPFVIRAFLGMFKAAFWVIGLAFRALAAIVGGLAKCLHAEKR